MSIKLVKFDIAEHLTDSKAIAEYLEACLDEGGIPLFLKGVGHAARASGMTEIAGTVGVTRASLYKSLSESGTPALATIDKVMNQLGLKFSITAIRPSAKAGRTYASGTVSGPKRLRVAEPALGDKPARAPAKKR
ncbi:hypothetical protein BH11PSE14_BH11PSE14_12470 [soil metagenome]